MSLARAVVDDATREVGPDDHLTLNARFEVAVWTREVDGATAAIHAFGELLDDLYALVDGDIGLVASVQWNLGGALTDAARPAEAVEFLDAAVEYSSRAHGPNHLITLNMRLSHIDAISDAGDLTRAIDLADALTQDSTRTVGPTHVITLTARGVAAACLAEAGDRPAALQRFEPLLADLAHLPADHWLVTEVRTQYTQLHQP